MKVAALQMKVLKNKLENLEQAELQIDRLAADGVDLVVLPEMFNCPYETPLFPVYAEPEGGQCWQRCSKMAGKYGVYLAAGSMPEADKAGRVYNTSYVFDRSGEMIGKHRKVHLFDIDVQGGQYFKESDTLSAGDRGTVFETEFGRMGLCICYDLRFPELSRQMVLEGAKMIVVPAAFNLTTGPAHWELLFRARAVDNQIFMLGAAPARDLQANYKSWGHSLAVSPWGDILGQLDEKEGVLVREIDLGETERIREQLPVLKQRRTDIYTV